MNRLTGLTLLSAVIAAVAFARTSDLDYTDERSINAPLTEVLRTDVSLFEPSWIQADANHTLWVSDAVHRTLTMYKYDLQEGESTHSLRMGRGPGELSEVGMKWMSTLGSGDKVIYDAGAYRMTRYSSALENPHPVRVPQGSNRWLSAHILADTLLVVSPMVTNSVVQVYRFDPSTNTTGERLFQVGSTDRPELAGLRNFLLKNGHVASHADALYFSFLFAPYIIKLDAKGLQWIGGGELGIGFPVNDKNPNEVRMPDASEHPQQTLSITADADRVYVLHNGEKAGFWQTMWATITNDFGDIDEQLNASTRLRIYNAQNGSFQEEWQLPLRARLVSVYGDFMYVATQIDGQPTIVAYMMSR